VAPPGTMLRAGSWNGNNNVSEFLSRIRRE
jgi:hypothetical protein